MRPNSLSLSNSKDILSAHARIQAISQYGLLYLALLSGQSYFSEYFAGNIFTVIGLGLFIAACLFPVFWRFRDMAYLASVLMLSVLVGTYVGGAGPGTFFKFSSTILLISFSITINNKSFPTRFLRLITVLAMMSMLVYVLRMVIPGFYYMLPLKEFESQGTYYSMLTAGQVPYHTKGVLFFSIREAEARNIGIFTEPGVYQGVLNGALFYVLFLTDRLNMGRREVTRIAVILLATLVTCGSTTGYVTFAVLFAAFLLSRLGDSETSLRSRLILVAVALLSLFLLDFFLRGEKSFLVENVIDKIFIGENGSADLSAGNSGARLDSVLASLSSLSEHPFGVGFDAFQAYKAQGAVGAGMFSYTASLGLPFAAITLYWLFAPVFQAEIGLPAKVAYLFMYGYFTFSQVLIMTPVIVSISLFLAMEVRKETHARSLAM